MRKSLIALLLSLAPVVGPATAAPLSDDTAIDVLRQLRADDIRLATIADRIARASAAICPVTQPLPGLVVHDLGQYTSGFRDAARSLFGADKGIAIEGIVPGSPAEAAGVQADDRLLAIDDARFDALQGDDDHMPAVRAAIDRAMADGRGRLELERGGRRLAITVDGVPGCVSRVEIRPSEAYNGWADGITAQLSSAMVDFTQDDDELATVIAHEMAHNILRHRVRLNEAGVSRGLFAQVGRNARLTRATEIEADRLGVYLMARAGFDPHAAARFWDRLLRQHGAGILADGTHLGRRKQVALVTGVAHEIDALKAAGKPLMPPLLAGPLPALD
ncbi:M48 family metallopeptidase [Sphingomonas sanxanigenens]|uniref:PDZ domain-containing protein n=1 Tax=Sphingomonas sanxanigenens DSM 19645 = NX02 TaxID=1123269 RepID=W0AB46_9SPHN|nr:M48 family metallopeptidase [Sphingomonas sanxanigenens]AHE52895.1 hypothetical protein NX02_05800 [Sphingomonas sanxanigenens DSM 19645 = NX02]